MIKLSHFTTLAQELVDASSALLGSRTVNIMDLDGIIIASSEKNRIGTRHAGAAFVATHREELAITKENVKKYPGAKEGYNMPLVCNGEMIGVIGIFGNPDEVHELAMLLRVYAVKYLELETTMNETMQDAEVKNSAFVLLEGVWEEENRRRFQSVTDALNIRFGFPLLAVRIRRVNQTSENSRNHWGLEILENEMLGRGMLHPRRDIWSYEDSTLRIIKSLGKERPECYKENLRELMHGVEFSMQVSVSEIIESWKELGTAYHKVLRLSRCLKGEFLDLSSEGTYMEFMLGETAAGHAAFLDRYIGRLKESFRDTELALFVRSMECYYQNDKSISRAAEKLFVHKNTMQYRVKKMREAVGLDKGSPFMQDYLMRLILLRLQQTEENGYF